MSVSRSERKFWTTEVEVAGEVFFLVRLDSRVYATESMSGLWDIVRLLPPDKPKGTIGEALGRPGHEVYPYWRLNSTLRRFSKDEGDVVLERIRRLFPKDFEEAAE